MGREIVWCENVRYLGVHVVSSKSFTCSLSKYGCIFSHSASKHGLTLKSGLGSLKIIENGAVR